VWIAVLVYAYEQGGATEAGLVALIQLAPSAVAAPFAATLADRHDPGRVLALGYVAQAVAMGATAAALLASTPPLAIYVLAAAAASATTITRPAQAVLIPSLVRGADELTATNVVCGWTESLSVLAAPVLTGALLGLSGPGAVFAAMAGVALGSALLAAPLRSAPAAPAGGGASDQGGSVDRAVAGFRMVGRDPDARVLVGLLGTQFLIVGALDVLFVVLAVDVLELGGSGAGYLNAAFGAGGVAGIVATVALVGRKRLAPPVVGAALALSLALLLIGLGGGVLAAFLMLAVAGSARTVLDVAARTLLQRTAPSEILARVFGLLETLDSIGLAVGSLLASALVALLGPDHAIAGLAVVIPVVILLAARRLRLVDAHADVPVVEVALLRSVPIFESLGATALEGLARALTPLPLRAGEAVMEQGDPATRYYVVADGALEVTRAGAPIATVGRADGVGEISLLRSVPCMATVKAAGVALVYAMEREAFIEAVSGHPASRAVADRLVRERLIGAAPLERAVGRA
jgi:MFS family permease